MNWRNTGKCVEIEKLKVTEKKQNWKKIEIFFFKIFQKIRKSEKKILRKTAIYGSWSAIFKKNSKNKKFQKKLKLFFQDF